jgi:hypothetical protein
MAAQQDVALAAMKPRELRDVELLVAALLARAPE